MGAVSGTPSPGCNGRGGRAAGEGPLPWPAGAGSGARRRGAGASAARGPPLPPPSARPPGPRSPRSPRSPSARSRLGFRLALGFQRAPEPRGPQPASGGQAGETPEAARGQDRRPERALQGPLRHSLRRGRRAQAGETREEPPGDLWGQPRGGGDGRPPRGRGGAPEEPEMGAHRSKKRPIPRWRPGKAADFL